MVSRATTFMYITTPAFYLLAGPSTRAWEHQSNLALTHLLLRHE